MVSTKGLPSWTPNMYTQQHSEEPIHLPKTVIHTLLHIPHVATWLLPRPASLQALSPRALNSKSKCSLQVEPRNSHQTTWEIGKFTVCFQHFGRDDIADPPQRGHLFDCLLCISLNRSQHCTLNPKPYAQAIRPRGWDLRTCCRRFEIWVPLIIRFPLWV